MLDNSFRSLDMRHIEFADDNSLAVFKCVTDKQSTLCSAVVPVYSHLLKIHFLNELKNVCACPVAYTRTNNVTLIYHQITWYYKKEITTPKRPNLFFF